MRLLGPLWAKQSQRVEVYGHQDEENPEKQAHVWRTQGVWNEGPSKSLETQRSLSPEK